MIQQKSLFEQSQNPFSTTFSELKVAQLLRQAGIRKTYGFSCFAVFQALFLLVFQGRNLFRTLESKRAELLPGKDVFYRFLNNPRFNWRRFYQMLSAKVVERFDGLTRAERVRVFIIDDATVGRERSKKVELLARIYDHVFHKFLRGFQLLTLGWSDGHSFAPLDFALMSSAKQANRYNEVWEGLDKRLCGYRRRQEAMLPKPEVVVQMVKRALQAGFSADYLLMDSWFILTPLVKNLSEMGVQVIGRLKKSKERYFYQGRLLNLKELYQLLPKRRSSAIQGQLCVTTQSGLPLKIVFVRNRDRKREWIALLTTDTALDEQEVVRIYGMRWDIETFHKMIKSHLKLGKEFEGRSYDLLISHTTIVLSRYLLLQWERRNNTDQRTFGELFFLFCDDVDDIDLKTALRQIMLFVFEFMAQKANPAQFGCQVHDWLGQLPHWIRAFWPGGWCES